MRTKPLIKLTQEEAADFYIERKLSFSFYTADYWEIVVPIAGVMEVSVEGKKRNLIRGVMAFFAPCEKRRISLKVDGGEYISLRFKEELIREVLGSISASSAEIFFKLRSYMRNVDDEHVRSIRTAIERIHIGEDEERDAMLKKLCYIVFLPFLPLRPFDEARDVAQKALVIMHDPRNVSARLPEIADMVGVSEEYLVRCFKKNGYETPNTIFKKIKMRYAKSVLTTQKISVAEVSSRIGFRSVGHFNKLYVAEYGVCPGTDKSRT